MGIAQTIIVAIQTVISVMEAVLIIRVLCEFKAIHRDAKPFRFLFLVSEPLLIPIRKMLLKQSKEEKLKFDISPFVVIILLYMFNIVLKKYIP